MSLIYWAALIVLSVAEVFTALGILGILAYAAPSQWKLHRDERREAAMLKVEARADECKAVGNVADESISPYGTHGKLYFVKDAALNSAIAMNYIRNPALLGGDRSPVIINLMLAIAAVSINLLMRQWQLAIAIMALAVAAHLALLLMWRLDEFLVKIVINYLQFHRVIRARTRSISFAQLHVKIPSSLFVGFCSS